MLTKLSKMKQSKIKSNQKIYLKNFFVQLVDKAAFKQPKYKKINTRKK